MRPPRDLLSRTERQNAAVVSAAPSVSPPSGLSEAKDLPRSKLLTGRAHRAARRDPIYRRALAVADVAAANGAILLSIAIIPGAQGSHLDLTTLVGTPLIVIMSKLAGLYDREELLIRKSTLEEVPSLFQLATLFALIAWLAEALLSEGRPAPSSLVMIWLALFVMLVLFRAFARSLSRFFTPPERCFVMGDASACTWMRMHLDRRRHLHAVVVGGTSAAGLEPQSPSRPPSPADLSALASSMAIDRIIITPDHAEREDVLTLVHSARSMGLKVSVLPRVLEVLGSSVEFDEIDGLPLLSVHRIGLSRSSRLAKRAFDFIGSVIGLVVLSPVLVFAAVAIKLESTGPALFRQRRVGRDGKPFNMLKLRTMVAGADEMKDDLRHLNEADGLFKIATDPRMTRIGRWLRRMSLDELPQLVNVLRGEMSLVGPRPLVDEEDRRIEGWRRRRLHLTPGMTGHWQILGSARIPLEEMSRIDYLYVTNWSLWLDLKIVLRTIPYVLAGKGM